MDPPKGEAQGDHPASYVNTLVRALSPQLKEDLLRCGDGKSYVDLVDAQQDLLAERRDRAIGSATALQQLAWEKLHEGHFKDVPMVWRQLYAHSSLIIAVALIHEHQYTKDNRKALETLDLALLMGGGPHTMPQDLWETLHTLIAQCQTELQKQRATASSSPTPLAQKTTEERESDEETAIDYRPPSWMKLQPVERIRKPSLEQFYRDYMQKGIPVIITGAMEGWPAMNERSWADLSYLKSIAGPRTVPIEVGVDYLHPQWSQKLMTFAQFVDDHVASSQTAKGYLAQVELFELVPELRRDFGLPEYCGLGEGDDVKIQAWFGPKGTVSPLHEDPYHNLLAQVVGRKHIRLYSPSNTAYLYPHGGKTLKNTSQVDVERPDLERFPLFAQARGEELILEAGEMLYLPPHYWHFVRSLSVSFSISFWWD